ncbi:DUF4397 domain-containing protein [Nostoc ellipsosporum NOK]|jgi:hypothetical protein|nr:DUF4397 domain-containing protein [Nostoc ellipsosporum NOK]
MKRILLVTLSVASAAIVFTGCLKDKNENPQVPVAGLMAFNLARDQNAVGFALSGNPISNTPLAFTNYTGGYIGVYTGPRSVEAYEFYTGNTLATNSVEFRDSMYYSTFLVGANGTYRTVITHDAFDSLDAATGQAYIRYINAIPDSSRPTVTVSAGGNNVINEQASFASVNGFKAAAPGSATIRVSNGGSISKERTITTESRKIYTVLLLGNPASGNAADSVQIRFVENGILDGSTSGRTMEQGRSSVSR